MLKVLVTIVGVAILPIIYTAPHGRRIANERAAQQGPSASAGRGSARVHRPGRWRSGGSTRAPFIQEPPAVVGIPGSDGRVAVPPASAILPRLMHLFVPWRRASER
jgi:hypothetical protein